MRRPPAYALFCLLVLALFTFAKYQGYALFGTPGQAAAAAGSSRSGSSGFHK